MTVPMRGNSCFPQTVHPPFAFSLPAMKGGAGDPKKFDEKEVQQFIPQEQIEPLKEATEAPKPLQEINKQKEPKKIQLL